MRRALPGPKSSQCSSAPGKTLSAAVNEIEIVEGLKPGDQVILSDMSQYDAYDRVRIK